MNLKDNKQEEIMKNYHSRNKGKNRIAKILELPQEVVTNEPKITLVGFNEMLIENYKAILEYEDFYIKINTHIGAININGFNLRLKEMTGDDIMVIGSIESIDFESITDEL
jgi:sporulation protein YqfC